MEFLRKLASMEFLRKSNSMEFIRKVITSLWQKLTLKNVLVAFSAYVILVKSVRYARKWYIEYKYGKFRGKLTPEIAQQMVHVFGSYEWPFMYTTSLQFALFKTYGIPTISKILTDTKQFSDPANASKRFADTAVLIGEWSRFPLNEPNGRSQQALARVNYIHSGYKISNDDYLYTLSVFITEPVKWVKNYDYREMTDLEIEALYVMWKEFGERMHIKNIPSTYESLCDWQEEYERDNMVLADSNVQTAKETMEILLYTTPAPLKGFVKEFLICFMDPRLKIAMGFEDPSAKMEAFAKSVIEFRKFYIRNFTLPRVFGNEFLSEKPNSCGRYNVKYAEGRPFYVRKTFLSTYGPSSWIKRIMGYPLPGKEYYSDGYDIINTGPDSKIGKGHDRQKKDVQEFIKRSHCPIKH